MGLRLSNRVVLATVALLCVVGCSRSPDAVVPGPNMENENVRRAVEGVAPHEQRSGTRVQDLFYSPNGNTTLEVNKYIWNASLEVLSFLPIEAADPFSGVIVTGYGTPPGGGRAYRATIYVTDPSLDARALKVALVSRNGPVSADTSRAVEDAILSRARQLRIRDSKL